MRLQNLVLTGLVIAGIAVCALAYEIHGAAAESSTLARHGADLRQQWVTGQRSLAVIQAENRRLETAYDRLGPATRRAQQQLVAAIHRTRRMRASVGQGAVRVRYLRRRASGTGG
jgi:hypothetical protein